MRHYDEVFSDDLKQEIFLDGAVRVMK